MKKLLYLPPKFIEAVNAWRRVQADIPSFSAAVVRLAMRGLGNG
jgi:hypothetical protein